MTRMYSDLAEWWHLLSPPADYLEEADFYARTLTEAASGPLVTLLELGSGGGNNASHLKGQFEMSLVDLSPRMLEQSRRLNPELEHYVGDMRTVRLGRTFDAVFVHDAIGYMTTVPDLRLAIETAYVHCRPGGIVLFAPDHVRENFAVSAESGGSDDGARGIRFLEWSSDPDPADDVYTVDYVYVLKPGDGSTEIVHEQHIEGLFSRRTWLDCLTGVGFSAKVLPFQHSEYGGALEVFVGARPVDP